MKIGECIAKTDLDDADHIAILSKNYQAFQGTLERIKWETLEASCRINTCKANIVSSGFSSSERRLIILIVLTWLLAMVHQQDTQFQEQAIHISGLQLNLMNTPFDVAK